MAQHGSWSFPAALQPSAEDARFDLERALDAVLQVRAEVDEDAFTAPILGTERAGNGVLIADDLVLTIGYLVTEARTLWLSTNRGTVVQGHALGYDQETGFGLVQPFGALGIAPLARGSAASLRAGTQAIVVGHGGRPHSLKAKIIARREFAGYWEYVLDEAIFTAPAHPQWGGAALVSEEGKLVGIGSLLVQEAVAGKTLDGNMFVPIDLLPPVLEQLAGGQPKVARPWLGLYTTEMDGKLLVGGLAPNGPGARAGIELGDIIIAVDGEPVTRLAAMFRKVWSLGPPGTEVPLLVSRRGVRTPRVLRSADRNDFLKKPRLH
jgi:S1-C subfamily serine protease